MSATDSTPGNTGNRKLVVLGVPWDVDTEGLRQFMSKYGELSDVIVMKDRATGGSRGFGYVTFASSESAEKALGSSHFLNGRMLDVKVATPKEVIPAPAPSGGKKKSKRIFVARVPLSITDDVFRSYFGRFGPISDVYMPKDKGSHSHRGIGFVTFDESESVDRVMAVETHQLGGATVAVDRATKKEKGVKEKGEPIGSDRGPDRGPDRGSDRSSDRGSDKFGNLPYGVFNSYLDAAARLGFLGMPPFLPMDYPGPKGGSQGEILGSNQNRSSGKDHSDVSAFSSRSSSYGPSASFGGTTKPSARKMFVGRIPFECTTEEVRSYFSKFGPLLDVYLPKDKEKTTHRGFAFVTFADESSVDQVVSRPHELRGQLLAIDQAAPMGETPSGGSVYNPSVTASSAIAGGPGPIRGGGLTSSNMPYGTLAGSGGYDYSNPWGLYSSLTGTSSKMDPRYRPY